MLLYTFMTLILARDRKIKRKEEEESETPSK